MHGSNWGQAARVGPKIHVISAAVTLSALHLREVHMQGRWEVGDERLGV